MDRLGNLLSDLIEAAIVIALAGAVIEFIAICIGCLIHHDNLWYVIQHM